MAKPQSEFERQVSAEWPLVTVVLDAGAFEWLHGIVQAKARLAGQRTYLDGYQALTARALSAFDEAHTATFAPAEETPAPRKRKVPPRVAERRKRR
jgi:hypothetical protein